MLSCNECGERRSTASGLYWHYRGDHGLDHYEAYEVVGFLLDETRGPEPDGGDEWVKQFGELPGKPAEWESKGSQF